MRIFFYAYKGVYNLNAVKENNVYTIFYLDLFRVGK